MYHIQVALRSHSDFAQVLESVESAALVLEYFLDDATSKALYDRQLISTRDAKHLRATGEFASEEEMIRMHERTRAEWQKREDDPFSEVDFAMVLKCVHPAFTLSYNATILLSALIRELLNEVCDLAQIELVQRRVPPEMYLDDIETPISRIFHVGDTTGKQIAKIGVDCLERFRLRSRKGTTLTIRFRVFSGPNAAAQSFRLTPQHMLHNVARETSFAQLVPQMCKKCHVDAAAMAAIYRGHQVELPSTPQALSMPTGAIVYLVGKKWWDHTRRNEARRGLLSSLRPQDAQLKSLVEGTESRVKKEFQLAAGNHPVYGLQLGTGAKSPSAAVMRRDESLEAKRTMKQLPTRSNNSNSTSSLTTTRSPGRTRNLVQATHSPIATQVAERERKVNDASDSDDPSAEDQEEGEEDSLSLLLKARPRNGMTMPQAQVPRQRSHDAAGNNNLSETSERDALSEMQQRHQRSPHAATVKTLAATNAQLMATLDDAWLGFAAVSGGVRSMNDTLSKWRAAENEQQEQEQQHSEAQVSGDAGPNATELAALEDELLARLEKTEELVAQTLAAKDLVAQLVDQVHRRRAPRK